MLLQKHLIHVWEARPLCTYQMIFGNKLAPGTRVFFSGELHHLRRECISDLIYFVVALSFCKKNLPINDAVIIIIIPAITCSGTLLP